MASANPADWRLCDPGDGSAAYYFNVETGDTLWDPPEGVDASLIREFGFEDEQVLDELGIEEAPEAAEEARATTELDPEARSVAGEPTEGASLIRASQAASDSTESPTPPPLPAAHGAADDAHGADPGQLAPPVSFDTSSGVQAQGRAGLAAPVASAPAGAAVTDTLSPEPATAAADGQATGPPEPDASAAPQQQQQQDPPRKPAPALRAAASMPAWGLSADEAGDGGGDHLGFSSAGASGRCFARVAAALGVWGRSGGTHSSVVGTLGHPIQGGKVSAAGQWVTRRGESRGMTRGEVYWVNRVTGETRWEQPEDADRAELSDAALAHSDVSDADPLLGCRPRAAEAEVLGDPDSRLERVWGGGTEHSDAASLLMRAGLMPEALAAAWGAAEEEAGEAATSAAHTANQLNAPKTSADISDDVTASDEAGGGSGTAPRPAAPAAAFLARPPWPTLPSIPIVVPAAPSDSGPLGALQACWRLVPALPSVAALAAEQYADAQAAGGEHGAAEHASAADALDDDVIGSLLVAASGPSLATGLYRRLSAMLVLMQSQGSDEDDAVDEESLFSFCLLLELALGATVMEPVQLRELGYPDSADKPADDGQAGGRADSEAAASVSLACLADAEFRYAASACLASALSAAPRGQTTAAVAAALSSLTLACEEAAFADPSAAAAAGVTAGLAPDAQGRIPGLSDVLGDHPSLLAGMAAGLLNVLVGVGEHHAEVSAGANPDQLTAATSLIRRLLQPGALPASVVSLFYTTDLHVLIDICLREVVDLPETDPLRAEYVLTLQEVLLLSQWHKEGSYRADDVVTVVSDLITSGAADAVPAVRDAAESLLLECRDLLDD